MKKILLIIAFILLIVGIIAVMLFLKSQEKLTRDTYTQEMEESNDKDVIKQLRAKFPEYDAYEIYPYSSAGVSDGIATNIYMIDNGVEGQYIYTEYDTKTGQVLSAEVWTEEGDGEESE